MSISIQLHFTLFRAGFKKLKLAYQLWSVPRHTSYLSFFLSTYMQLLVQFFSSQKCVNRNKIYFVTKQRKLRQNSVNRNNTDFTTKQHKFYICGDILHITHMPDVEKFQISPHLSCMEIWKFSTWQILFCTDPIAL